MPFQRGEVVTLLFPLVETVMPRHTPHPHPAAVISTPDYEATTGNVIVTMITSQPHTAPSDYRLQDWEAAGLRRPSTVRAKPSTVAPHRILRRAGRLSNRDLAELDARLRLAMGL
ncbi:MAG: type II toxin-antitoxin system PemK/MazF family toxin [Planctomycetes bacterium]|nr:type II toxin-antitoxin system PemK/MazF family toxin [Planctomycetota bacterium]MBM4078635.1 type II toxin-antitoxin system PemK/MazF family toxin [Planctomycetota bacterium]